MNKFPLVSIIILNWNGYKITLECLKSLLKIDYKNFKIIVVDNGSIDDSINEIKANIKDEKLDYLILSENLGFTGGNNEGIAFAKIRYNPEYFLLLNNDTIVETSFLSKMIEAFDWDHKCFAVVPKIFYYDQPQIIWFAGGKISRIAGTVTHNGVGKKDSDTYKSGPTEFMNGCCALISKKAINAIGLLDNQFFATSEDVDYSIRILNSGHTIQFVNEAIIYHKISISFRANSGKWLAFYLGSRGMVLLQKKHLKGIDIFYFYFLFFFRWIMYLTFKLFFKLDFKSIKSLYVGTIDGVYGHIRYVNKQKIANGI